MECQRAISAHYPYEAPNPSRVVVGTFAGAQRSILTRIGWLMGRVPDRGTKGWNHPESLIITP